MKNKLTYKYNIEDSTEYRKLKRDLTLFEDLIPELRTLPAETLIRRGPVEFSIFPNQATLRHTEFGSVFVTLGKREYLTLGSLVLELTTKLLDAFIKHHSNG